MMNDEVLVHHGIKGQRWGVRRFQNEDGTRTALGRKRERQAAGSGKLFDKNNSSAAQKYKEAKAAEKQILNDYPKYGTDDEWNEYDRKTNEALDARKQAFKESKADFKANKTLGQKAANLIMNGPIGAGLYNNLRASGNSVAVSEALTIASNILGGPLGQSAAHLLTRKG